MDAWDLVVSFKKASHAFVHAYTCVGVFRVSSRVWLRVHVPVHHACVSVLVRVHVRVHHACVSVRVRARSCAPCMCSCSPRMWLRFYVFSCPFLALR